MDDIYRQCIRCRRTEHVDEVVGGICRICRREETARRDYDARVEAYGFRPEDGGGGPGTI